MLTNKNSIDFANFLTHEATILILRRGHIRYIVSIHYLFTNLLLYSSLWTRNNDDQGRVYNDFKIQETRGIASVLGRVHKSHLLQMHYFFTNLLLYS